MKKMDKLIDKFAGEERLEERLTYFEMVTILEKCSIVNVFVESLDAYIEVPKDKIELRIGQSDYIVQINPREISDIKEIKGIV